MIGTSTAGGKSSLSLMQRTEGCEVYGKYLLTYVVNS